jgi:hypothetical protein
MWRHVDLVRTDESEERIAFVISVKRINGLGTTLAISSNRSTLLRNTNCTRKEEWDTREIGRGGGGRCSAGLDNKVTLRHTPEYGNILNNIYALNIIAIYFDIFEHLQEFLIVNIAVNRRH